MGIEMEENVSEGKRGHSSSLWARRFGIVALINAVIAVTWLIFPLFIDTNIARTIAGGSAGTWGYVGFLLFAIVGFGGFAGFSSLYSLIPTSSMSRVKNTFAWLHLTLMEVGTLGATTLLGIAGYIGGVTILEETAKGTPYGEILGIVHSRIVFVIEPVPLIPIFAAIAAIGILLGVFVIFLSYWVKVK